MSHRRLAMMLRISSRGYVLPTTAFFLSSLSAQRFHEERESDANPVLLKYARQTRCEPYLALPIEIVVLVLGIERNGPLQRVPDPDFSVRGIEVLTVGIDGRLA